MLRINDQTNIAESELQFSFARSSGPGGQNVNKVSSRVTLIFDLENSPSLSVIQKDLIRNALKTRINKNGILRIIVQCHRSQDANRKIAIERFVQLLSATLKKQKPRIETKVSKTVKQKRLEGKRHRSQIKKFRSKALNEASD